MWPIAAVIALTLLLVGCAVAYANGWFQQIFSARSETPLSSEQIQYIQNNEQIVGQSQTKKDWTVDLKSTICDGRTGYLVFQITAPDDVDLEKYLNPPTLDDKRLSMGNDSASRKAAYSLAVASIGTVDSERNYWYLASGDWVVDGDGQPNTVLFCMTIRCEKMDPSKPMLLEDPFGKDVCLSSDPGGLRHGYWTLDAYLPGCGQCLLCQGGFGVRRRQLDCAEPAQLPALLFFPGNPFLYGRSF